ncbi:MAG: fatty acid CoA ligase family protein [Bacteriovoracaceae bacterium]|jgi:acyl-coenzyme A synthetase/AMP-(fatty) acid ligase|nr:fatty acid CoA ligase family protein [Bacteriovoracaceae bacterium]
MNLSDRISEHAISNRDKLAVICPSNNNSKYISYTFLELENKINQFANKLTSLGVKKDDVVLIFIKPYIDFSAIIFACYKIGAVCTFIDPGMGRKKLLESISKSTASVLIGIKKVHIARMLFRSSFKDIKLFITTDRLGIFSHSIYKNLDKMSSRFKSVDIENQKIGSLLYTSGGTGAPKPVIYTQKILMEQTKKLQNEFDLKPQDTDLAGFPLFALFTLSMGMSSVIPFMDPAAPAKADPQSLIKNIKDNKCSFIAGSPAIWNNMVKYCNDNNIKLDTVKYFVMFGAPISYKMHKRISNIIPNGTSYTPYGATESLPVSNISGKQILKEFSDENIMGKGICVGTPMKGVKVNIIKKQDGAINNIKDCEFLKTGQVGEIIVNSTTTTIGYNNMEDITKASKIYDENTFWHRMGDMGYMDDKGQLWFLGRVAHTFETNDSMYTPINIEQFFIAKNEIEKAAFIRAKNKNVIILNSKNEALAKDIIKKNNLPIDKVLVNENFPVDIRHNIKIDRKKLSTWAIGELS